MKALDAANSFSYYLYLYDCSFSINFYAMLLRLYNFGGNLPNYANTKINLFDIKVLCEIM